MEGRPERIADYFVVVGVGCESVTKFEAFSSEEEQCVLPGDSGSVEPITDVAVVYTKYEQLPKGYKIIETTVGGQSANLNAGNLFSNPMYLCYFQSRDKPPIIEMSVFHTNQNQSPPPGHVTLAFSVGGRSADLSRSGRSQSHLTLKRGLLFGHNNAITGLCIIGKGDEPPPRYKILHSLDLGKGLVGPSLYLCYRTSQVHPHSVPYTPELLSRYPLMDYPEFPLPGSVPLFCLPFGVSVEHWDRHTPFPLPSFSTFALTNAQGQCMYGAVVVFYEPVVDHKCVGDMRKALGVADEEVLHMNKCICLLSHWPFFQSFKAFLSALYRLSISKNIPLPLERYVGNLMLEVPFPSMMRPRVQMQIGNETILFSLPVQTPLPLSVSTHWTLLSSLDAENCLILLALMLLEQKMVLHSSRPALLTCVGEALRSILFPYSWQCTYIPLCPVAFSSYLQAPVPFIIGMDSRYFDIFEKPADVSVIDLDANIITLSKDSKQLLKERSLPSRPAKVLRQSLSHLCTRASGLDSGMDLAVEVAPMEYKVSYKSDLETIDVEIREAFLRFFATTMGHYRKCLRPLLSAPSERSRDAEALFDQHQFLKHCPSSEWPFFKYFFDTQIFNGFIEQRSFDHSESTAMAFFDECAEKVKTHPQTKLLDAVAIVNKRSDLPTVVSIPPDSVGLPPGKTYSYSVYPVQLDHTLFSGCVEGEGPISRTSSLRNIVSSSPIVGRRTQAEKTKDKQSLQKALQSDVMWSKCLLSHVCSLWYVLLSSHLSTHWNKMEVISQALELLEQMRKQQALPNDEVCYRILMEQCVKLHRPALAVRVYHEMIRAGIQPNAVTYSFYNSAVLEGEWPSCRRKWKILITVVCVCLYWNNLKNKSKNLSISSDRFDEVDFSLITRKASSSSRKSISALDVVGVAEGVGSFDEDETLTLKRNSVSHKGSAYRLTRIDTGDKVRMTPGGGVADTDNKGLWSNVRISTGVQSSSPAHIRRLSRVVTTGNLGDPPSLKIEMTSCTQCSSCQHLLYDELIMAGWSVDDGDYKTSCPYCSHKMVANLTIVTKQTLPRSQATDISKNSVRSKLTTPTSIVEENEDQMDFELRTKSWDRRHVAKRTRSKDTNEIKTVDDDKLTGAVNNFLDSSMLPRTDPLHRRAITDSNLTMSPTDEPLTSENLKVIISNTDRKCDSVPNSPARHPNGIKNGNGTSSVTVQSTNSPQSTDDRGFKSTKYKGHDEPDAGGLTSHIAAMRARGHKRSTSAPIHPIKEKVGGISSLLTSTKGSDKWEDSLAGDTKSCVESSPPLMVPYLSPVVLRKEVETLISLDGATVLEREELVKDRPIIYWNLVWYFSRLHLPTHLPMLTLQSVAKTNTDLKKHYVEMKVNLFWDSSFSNVRSSLYNLWLGRVSGSSVPIMSTPELKRRDSESQLQSLVARTQCGDLLPVVTSLLRDKMNTSHDTSHDAHLVPRSIYRETLFLKSVLTSDLDVDLFDKEYQQVINRLPKDLSPLLQPQDLPPTNKALNCRRDFGPLQVSP